MGIEGLAIGGVRGLPRRPADDAPLSRPGLFRPARREPPTPSRGRHSPKQWIVAGAATLILLDGAASLLLPAATSPITPPAAQAAVLPGYAPWQDIPGPLHLYDLSGSPFARLPLIYAARRNAAGDARQDLLTYGAFGGPAPFLQLAMFRHGPATGPAPDFVVDLARLAATGGLAVTRVGLPLNVMTRFGRFDTADITLEHAAAALPCLGFRLAGEHPVAMTGLVCGGEAPLDRSTLDCVLDRIDLISAGDDQVLRDMFVAAERRRGDACLSGRHRAAAPRE